MTGTAVIVMEMRDGEDIQSLANKVELAVHRMDLDQANAIITPPIIKDERGLFRDGHHGGSFYVNRAFIDELRTICGRMPAPESVEMVHPGGIFG